MSEFTPSTVRRTLASGIPGFVGGAVALGAFYWALEPTGVAGGLIHADPVIVLATAVVALLAVIAWGAGLRIVLGILDAPVPWRWGPLLILAAVFFNAITPFGPAGADPLSGGLIARLADVRFERGLVAISGTNAVNRAVSMAFAAAAAIAIVTVDLDGGGWIRAQSWTVPAAVLTAGVAAMFAAWRYRTEATASVARLLTPPARIGGRYLPGLTPPTDGAVAERVRGALDALEQLVEAPRRLAVVVAIGGCGELCVAGALWLALSAVGSVTSPVTLLVLVPASRLAAVVPTPGGLGGVDVALVGLLVAATGTNPATAGTGVLLYRLGTYAVPMVLGGAVVGVALAADRA